MRGKPQIKQKRLPRLRLAMTKNKKILQIFQIFLITVQTKKNQKNQKNHAKIIVQIKNKSQFKKNAL